MKIKYYILLLLIFVIAACKPAIDEFSPQKGQADFTSYLAVGNSLTAGYADGSLYKSGQDASYANILSKQFASVGGGSFKQPDMVDDFGFGFDGILPAPKFVLGPSQDCMGEVSLAPVRAPVDVDMNNFTSVAAGGPYNNIGVPGAKTYHLLFDQYAALNPYYARFAPDQNTPVIHLTAAFDATFFTLWIGNNDLLGWASEGGASDSLTDPMQFGYFMDLIIKACIQNQPGAYEAAKGAVANIPDITGIPFFTFMNSRVPYNGLVLSADTAALLTQLYAMNGHPEITFQEGPNAWVVEKSNGSFGRMTEEDMFIMTLPTDSMICFGMGVANMFTFAPYPIPHRYILDKTEKWQVQQHVMAYNAIIYDLCTMYGLAHVDMYQLMNETAYGVTYDGILFTNDFIQGNLFSLDGIHGTPTGNAVLANHFIEAINKTYNAAVPLAIVSDYGAVVYP